ncbi:MAG: DUF166 family protein [Promethearchaeota archaeon]
MSEGKNKKIKVGVITDGKYGERAYINIKKVFEANWIVVPEIPTNIILDDEMDLDITDCDLYISYVRHSDIILQLAELQKPLILGVLPGNGLYEQAKRINSRVIHAKTMCSLECNTEIPEIDEFIKFFGRPIYETNISSELIVQDIKVKRSSLCGSSEAGAKNLINKSLNPNNLQNFALSVCHECRAPRFGRTCDKEVAGIIHLNSLFNSFPHELTIKFDQNLKSFIKNMKNEYERRKNN